jgi:large subunit ribosomal protein L2
MIIASSGMKIGQKVEIKPLKDIAEGTKVYNLEVVPGDGGKLCRSSGMFATVITSGKKCVVTLPSKKKKTLVGECLATVGTVAGSGRKDKPLMKAGKAFKIKKAFGQLYPRTSGVAMNAVDHPFGGSASPGKHKTVSRHAPPGRKVGNIAAKRMGRRKG